jgi:hypothetical protein
MSGEKRPVDMSEHSCAEECGRTAWKWVDVGRGETSGHERAWLCGPVRTCADGVGARRGEEGSVDKQAIADE